MDSTIQTEDTIEVTGGSLAVLSPQTGEPIGQPVSIGIEPCIVGRGEHCHVVLNDPHVSASHCQFIATPKGVRVMDLGAKNGTYIHPTLITEKNAVYVTADARLRCGQTWLALRVIPERVPISSSGSFGPIVGRSAAMRAIYTQLANVAPTELSVLITGETGTGKQLVARAIHEASARRANPFMTIDCATITASLAESVLFGHEKGAFTGAISKQVSPFVEARGGTVFLDEIGDLPPELQPKLLRALQEREIRSVGSTRYQPIDVRIIAATWHDLHEDVNGGHFRADLLHRFKQVHVHVPPLRERREDIPDLVAQLLSGLGDPSAVTRLDSQSRDRLLRHDWPGNVRELRNVIEVAYALSNGGPILVGEQSAKRTKGSTPFSLDRPYEEQEREHLEAVEAFRVAYFSALYGAAKGSISEMSRMSGLARSTVREHVKRLGLRGSDE